jgi:hypothetical protein
MVYIGSWLKISETFEVLKVGYIMGLESFMKDAIVQKY